MIITENIFVVLLEKVCVFVVKYIYLQHQKDDVNFYVCLFILDVYGNKLERLHLKYQL